MKFKKKIALITGITGQDGAYLLEFLLKKKYVVHGIKRRASSINTQRIDHIFNKQKDLKKPSVILHHGDMSDGLSIQSIIKKTNPDEIYNLAAQSHVAVSFEQPEYTANSDALGVLRILEAVRMLGKTKTIKIYQASTSELYGKVQEKKQNEKTPFYPRSPYGVAKLYAYWIIKNYREAYNIFACNGILFNHESPLRGETFVTKKIIKGLVRIKYGYQKKLILGNLYSKRDWGHAKDYIRMMWLILQAEKPEDWVIASGKSISVRDFIRMSFRYIGVELEFRGKGLDEKGFVKNCSNSKYKLEIGKEVIQVDSKYFRPTEVDLLLGDASKARNKLNWTPEYTLNELVNEMMASDLILMQKDQYLKKGGYSIKNYFE